MSHPPTRGPVVEVHLAASADAWGALATCLRDLTGETRALVVHAAGREANHAAGHARPDVVEALARPDLISVAAASGPLVGARLSVAAHCDLRVLGASATIRLAADAFGCLGRLAAVVGYPRALELCLTGRRLSAREAESIGLANLVVADEQLDNAVADLVAALLATPRDVAIEMKAALARGAAAASDPRARLVAGELAAIERLAGDNEDGPDAE